MGDFNKAASSNLEGILARFNSLPTELLLAETLIYTTTEEPGFTLRKSAAAAMGYKRGGLYLDAARSLLAQILADAAEVSWRKQAYDTVFPLAESAYRFRRSLTSDLQDDLGSLVSLLEGAKYLLTDAEILWHLYAVCLDRSRHFMQNSVQLLDPSFQLNVTEKNYVDLIRAFRNHLEHRDKAIASLSGIDWQSFSEEKREIITIGYSRTADNEIHFYPADKQFQGAKQKMPINNQGLRDIEKILQRMHKHIHLTAIAKLRTQFTEHPKSIPAVEIIGQLVSDYLAPTE